MRRAWQRRHWYRETTAIRCSRIAWELVHNSRGQPLSRIPFFAEGGIALQFAYSGLPETQAWAEFAWNGPLVPELRWLCIAGHYTRLIPKEPDLWQFGGYVESSAKSTRGRC